MKLRFSGVLADVRALWRGNTQLLARVAAVFYFLPALAEGLFLPLPDQGGLANEAFTNVLVAWYLQNAPWLGLIVLVQSFGSGLLLVLLIAPAGLQLDAALGRTLRLLPGLILVWLGSGLLAMFGALAFLVPGFYLIGRTFVVGASYVDAPENGPLAALREGIRRTHGNGWLLLSITMMILLGAAVVSSIVDAFAAVLAAAGVPGLVHDVIDSLGIAGIAAAGALLQTLVQASVYRALKASESAAPPRG